MIAGTEDVIAAVATPPGKGGVGVIRVSGKNLESLLFELCKKQVEPRRAVYTAILEQDGEVIDQGLVLFFPAPHSFTGEDVVEIQGHGGPVVMDCLLQRTLELGARVAGPGEFSLRAFLNDKIDLAQAEAIADLIEASSQQAARSAMRSLQGQFSQQINKLVDMLVDLRTFIEAAIDFPDEEIDFLSEGRVLERLLALNHHVEDVLKHARQGVLLGEGMTVVIAGKPNAGKSSLLNALSGRDTAIVTDIAGTTRDVLRERINIDGMPLHVVDTAGLRESQDAVELEGIRRAWNEIEKADRILFVIDATLGTDIHIETLWPEFFRRFPNQKNVSLVFNKADCLASIPALPDYGLPVLMISARTGMGLDELKTHLKECMGYQVAEAGNYMARRRHLEILNQALEGLKEAEHQLLSHGAAELVAEDLRVVQHSLGEITGAFTPDDLLGKIFSSFCIGK